MWNRRERARQIEAVGERERDKRQEWIFVREGCGFGVGRYADAEVIFDISSRYFGISLFETLMRGSPKLGRGECLCRRLC